MCSRTLTAQYAANHLWIEEGEISALIKKYSPSSLTQLIEQRWRAILVYAASGSFSQEPAATIEYKFAAPVDHR
jgi:hypothetical protein